MQLSKTNTYSGMDIDYELDKLIFKYNIDKRYPAYKKYVKGYRILKDIYEELLLKEGDIILISDSATDIKWMQSCICNREEKKLLCNCLDISKYSFEEDNIYINLSYSHRDELNLILAERELESVSIYNVFEQHDLYFQNAFFDVYAEEYMPYRGDNPKRDFENFDICLYFFRHRRLFELSKSPDERQLYLEKIVFDCIMAKDFLMLKKYINLMQTEEKAHYEAFYQEIEFLLKKIKGALLNYKDNVCVFWIDAVEYEEMQGMTYLKEVEETAVTFLNAYTVTPYTGATFKTLLTGKKIIDDETYCINRILEEDSVLIRELKKQEFDFKYYGPLELLEESGRANEFYTWYTPITRLYWDLLRDILLQQENDKGVWMLHEALQTHSPFISLGLTGTQYNGSQDWPGQQSDTINNDRQARESRKYVDEQLRFYGELLPKEMTKIYLSDHGHTQFGRFHTFLKIQSESLKPCRIGELFSYVDFYKLLVDVACKRPIDVDYLSREYVQVQDVPYYNGSYINALIQECDFHPEFMMGYQGVITSEDMLIKYNNGKYFYFKQKNDEIMFKDDRVEYLRGLLGSKNVDVWNDNKFEASKKIYRAWDNSSIRYEKDERGKYDIINSLFSSVKESQILAIRGGGVETAHLMMLLPYKLRKKVKYIIDYNRDCLVGRMGIRVITPEEIQNYKIDKILLSSFEYKDVWKEELSRTSAELIDLYREYEKAGIDCTRAFYKRKYIPQDFIL